MAEEGTVRAVSVGHDHCNDGCASWRNSMSGDGGGGEAISLCYGGGTGYSGYVGTGVDTTVGLVNLKFC